ncbi:WcbI family polysaccharide biosynthesis putative acetyltransferase [Alteromonas macleodii]|uniref:WcbI family polysaccharide biosynthesis putative acetyltransferase n=1 Tax=Alteromonas macleodii TaxID=28108 RepID=UPI00313B6D0A
MKILVIGNCQARPISRILSDKYENIYVLDPIIAHLAKNEMEHEYIRLLESADVIISQHLSDDFNCEVIRSNNLKNLFKEKIVLIPNLYYRGYNPELMYIRMKGEGTLRGPLGDYHHHLLFEAWLGDMTTVDAEEYMSDKSNWNKRFSNVAEKSLETLRDRERFLDVTISKEISDQLSSRKLFFTFNHPTLYLLDLLVDKISAHIGSLKKATNFELGDKEPLDLIVVPSHESVIEKLGGSLEKQSYHSSCFKGLSRVAEFDYKGPKFYSLTELIESFYNVYNTKKNDLLIKGVFPPYFKLP